ncbi:MAG: glycosyltransferase family 2 protein [Psychroserpens sp.]|uniref:glycosyltransferase family 2 protein n=1 Tax=Psychroserpens sp. TaxID=2020870 RepID=UPI003CA8FC14
MILSVIIPVFNAEDFIQKSYASIIGQHIEDIEILYIDNNSTDGSVIKINNLIEKDSRITLLHQLKKGAAPTRNKGLQHASGKYIYLFDVDDEIFPNALKDMLEALESNEAVDAVFGKMIKSNKSISETPKPNDETFKLTIEERPYWGLKWLSDLSSVVGPPAFLYRASVFNQIGHYNEALRIGQDTALDIRLGMLCHVAFLDRYVYLYFKHEESTIQKVKKKMPRAFMVWPRLVQEHLSFYLQQDVPLRFKTLLFAQIYQAMARQIVFTSGLAKRSKLKGQLLSEIKSIDVPFSIRFYLGILVVLPFEPLRKIYGYHIVPAEIKKLKV